MISNSLKGSNLIIEFTKSEVFGEPGPNLCWFGSPGEFKQIVSIITKICDGSLQEIAITSSDVFHLFGCKSIVLTSSKNGIELVHDCGGGVIKSNLSKSLWKQIKVKFESVDQLETFQYIEFDDRPDLIEDANWIIECRADEERLLKKLAAEYS